MARHSVPNTAEGVPFREDGRVWPLVTGQGEVANNENLESYFTACSASLDAAAIGLLRQPLGTRVANIQSS